MPSLARLPRSTASLLRTPLRFGAALGALASLGGCDWVVMNPAGDIALQQRDLVILATLLMLLIVIPVIVATCVVAYRYRATNADATYSPDWDHSTQLELMIWSAPLLIIICLGAVTWTGAHLLDPYRPIDRLASGRAIPKTAKPLVVEVVSLDWKWLFIYPEYGFATVNELAAPVDRPIEFRLTSSSVMNAFYVPTLAGMIYTMPSMQTQLHAVINKVGDYRGISANYSGAGFSGMHFHFYGMTDGDFAGWVARNKGARVSLSKAVYGQLQKPTENVPVMRFGTVDPTLYHDILNQCVQPGTTCMSDMMKKDGGDTAAMTNMPNHGTPLGQRSDEPLTTTGAGGPAPKNPTDVKQRGPSTPDTDTTPRQTAK